MLYSLDTNSFVYEVPHQEEFGAWKSRLSATQYAAIRAELGRQIETGEIHHIELDTWPQLERDSVSADLRHCLLPGRGKLD